MLLKSALIHLAVSVKQEEGRCGEDVARLAGMVEGGTMEVDLVVVEGQVVVVVEDGKEIVGGGGGKARQDVFGGEVFTVGTIFGCTG